MGTGNTADVVLVTDYYLSSFDLEWIELYLSFRNIYFRNMEFV